MSTVWENVSSMLASGGNSSAPGSRGAVLATHELFVAAAASADWTSPALIRSCGVVKRWTALFVGSSDSPENERKVDLIRMLTARSVGQSATGSKRAIDVVTHRTEPATCGVISNGLRCSGSWPEAQSEPRAMTACVNVTVIACLPLRKSVGAAPPPWRTAAESVDGVNAAMPKRGCAGSVVASASSAW
eukprot:scaffold190389_cov31-Tisochrysis_lutea.AAC.1